MRLPATRNTPYVYINPLSGNLIFKGRSSAHSSLEFYEPILTYLRLNMSAQEIMADFQLEYFNTSTCKCLMQLFKWLGSEQQSGKKVKINWFIEQDDDDMLETGEDFECLSGLTFNMVEVSDQHLTSTYLYHSSSNTTVNKTGRQ